MFMGLCVIRQHWRSLQQDEEKRRVISGMIRDIYFPASRLIWALTSITQCWIQTQQIQFSLFSNKALQPGGLIFLQSNSDGFQVFGFKLQMVGHLQPRNDVNLTQKGGSSVSTAVLIPSFTLCNQVIYEFSRVRISPSSPPSWMCGKVFFFHKHGNLIKYSQL